MNSGTRKKTLIAGTVGLAALGGIALAKRRGSGETGTATDEVIGDEVIGTEIDNGQAGEPTPDVSATPAASELERPLLMDPVIE